MVFSLTALALAACSSSSGGKSGDALGPGGVSGGDGGAGSGPPSGSAAGDASTPPGGGAGGTGGGGGTPSPCSDPAFPVPCPAHGDVPAICWSAGTDCSTIIKCGDQFRSCPSANAHYDCAQMSCVYPSGGDGGTECGDPSVPVSCPASGDVPRLCWSPRTVCSTIGRCGSDFKSCQSAGFHFSCTEVRCVADSDGGISTDASLPDAAVDVAPADARTDSD